jgi:pimeloyl-ACP methyl ester carboxylesterase
MVGSEDRGFDLAAHALEFAKELPDAEVEVFEGAGHSIHAERTDAVTARILRLLDERSKAP